jgi:hypothetical protein
MHILASYLLAYGLRPAAGDDIHDDGGCNHEREKDTHGVYQIGAVG